MASRAGESPAVYSLARMGRIAALQSAGPGDARASPAAALAGADAGGGGGAGAGAAAASGASAAAAAAAAAAPVVDAGGARALEAAARALIGEAAVGAWLATRARGGRRMARGDVALFVVAQPARLGFAADLLHAEDLIAALPPA
jgi:hypothetical protein